MAAGKTQGRSRERGQLIKRGSKKYLIRVYLGRIDGKRKYTSKTIEGTKKQADAELVRWLREMDKETFVSPQETKRLHAVALEWLAAKRLQGIQPRTLRSYERFLHQRILPKLGYLKTSQIARPSLQGFFDELSKDFAPSSLRAIRSVLAMVLRYSRELGYSIGDPLRGLKLPKAKHQSGAQVLTPEQSRELLAVNRGETRYLPLFALLLGTGMRPGEACALKWDDLDEKTGVVTIRRVLRDWDTRKKLRVAELEAKTKGSLGSLKVPESVLEILREHRQAMLEEQLQTGVRTDWMFHTRDGQPPLINNIRKTWEKACERAEVPVVRLYDTRHTHATQLLKAGVHMKVIQGRLRHANFKTTMDAYSHLSDEMDTKAADTFDELLKTQEAKG